MVGEFLEKGDPPHWGGEQRPRDPEGHHYMSDQMIMQVEICWHVKATVGEQTYGKGMPE